MKSKPSNSMAKPSNSKMRSEYLKPPGFSSTSET